MKDPSNPSAEYQRGTRVRHLPTGLVGVVAGRKNEGHDRGYTVTVREDDGRVHHFRAHRIEESER